MRVDKKVKFTYHHVVVHLESWIRTNLNTPVELMASHPLSSLSLQGCVLLIGGVHGDEPLGVELAQATAQWLTKQSNCNPWVVIPCLNVDGYQKRTRTNSRGVDINRNYPASNWSPDCKGERYFPGSSAGSEIETQGVVQLVQTLRPQLIIHCHSWHPCIVRSGAPGDAAAQALAHSSGYKVVDDIGYETPGSLSQFGWVDHKIPVICIEESDDSPHGITWQRFASGMKFIFQAQQP